MNWLNRLFAPASHPEDRERTRKTEETLSIANDFMDEMRRDIERARKRRETDVGNALLRARDARSTPS